MTVAVSKLGTVAADNNQMASQANQDNIELVDLGNGEYKVLVNGATHVVSSSIDCNVGDYVWVCAPCGNINNMFVVCKTR